MIDIADRSEAETFLKENSDIESIDLLIADLNGVFRGKRVYPDALTHVYEDGILLAKSLFASDITGATSDYSDIGILTGDKDCRCVPLSNTIYRTPWKKRAAAQVQMIMQEPPGTPYPGDPQTIIDNLTNRFEEIGLTPVVAIEMEFYLIDREQALNNEALATISPVTGKRQHKTQVYSITDLDDYGDFIDGIMHATRIQQIPANVAVAEYAPGQYEINLRHQANAQLACSHGLLLKRLIKGVAEQHGYCATFMPKPFQHSAGNGTHIHVSLMDKSGNNIFGQGGVNNIQLRNAIAGLIDIMSESMLIYAPGANSYRRFVKGMFTPLNLNWGYNNRTVAVRIPSGNSTATRIEHRVSGADTNPYLLTASVLAGIHHGLTNNLEPPPITTGDAHNQPIDTTMPNSWQKAIESFNTAKVLPSYLGQDFCSAYSAIKQQEYELFSREITPLEFDWYLRNS
ncbi:MAG: glutamine synthetase family protein [Arenicellales bacterium]|nr:glutamine synthetase family protein [Arenicellales bacterium]